MEGILTMSQKKADRIGVLSNIESNNLTIEEAARILKISFRQVYRIIKRVEFEGTKGVIHKLRSRRSNRGYPEELKKKIAEIYRREYWDYGLTLFSEMLVENHNISVDYEIIRKWLRGQTMTTSLRKKRPHRRKRQRRSCYGELLQFDGSYHD